MTADERIEKLLNRFGQTIADLPKEEASQHAYSWEHLDSANLAACRWLKRLSPSTTFDWLEYICHLCDVIDRMETALETAVRWSSCFTCARFVKDFPSCKAKYWEACFNMSDSCFIDENVEVEDEDS